MSAVAKKARRAAPRKRRAVIGGKGGQAKQKQPSIASNSVPSISTARITYLWSWGSYCWSGRRLALSQAQRNPREGCGRHDQLSQREVAIPFW